MIDTFDIVLKEQIATCTGMPDSSFTAEINIGSYPIDVIAVVAYTQRQDYLNSMFEEAMLTVAMQPSEYSEGVLVGHEDITIKLTQRPYVGGQAYVKHYRGVLVEMSDEQIEGNVKDVGTGTQDMTSISVITFQIISEAAYDLRLREFGNIYANTDTLTVIKSILGSMALKDRYSSSEAIASIVIDPVDNVRQWKSVKIPDGTALLAVPDYLQEHYGIYQSGMGCFLKNQTWYVFSPFNKEKRNQDVERLVVFNAPATTYRSLERNFKVDGKTLTVIGTGETKHSKGSDAEALNSGTGIRYATLSSLDSGSSTVDPAADPSTTADEYMTEYRGSDYASPYQNTVTSKERHSDNPLKESSTLAARGGEIVTVTWENGTLMPLLPGMPVKYHYGKSSKLSTMEGTLVSAVMISNIPLGGIVDPRHTTSVQLTLWLRKF